MSNMDDIAASSRKVNGIGEITMATSSQSSGIDEVGGAIDQLEPMTLQNAALVEQSAAAAESLKSQALRLAEMVSTFPAAQATGGAVTRLRSRAGWRRSPAPPWEAVAVPA
jgi:methyl-accepting chemotaxis protein